MVRVTDLDASLAFFITGLGMVETRRAEVEAARFTLVFVAFPDDTGDVHGEIELTYNWDVEPTLSEGKNFGHIAIEVDDIYDYCQGLMDRGLTIIRPPRDGQLAFVRSPDNISVEIVQKGILSDGESAALPPTSPWREMENAGDTW